MTSLTVSDLAAQIAAAVSGDRGLNAPIFPDGLVRFHSKNIAVPFFQNALIFLNPFVVPFLILFVFYVFCLILF